MKLGVRIGLYVILAAVAAIFFSKFRSAYHEGVDRGREPAPTVPAALDGAVAPVTEAPTNQPSAEPTVSTNEVAIAAGAPVALTNEGRSITNPATANSLSRPAVHRKAASFIYLGVFVVALLGLGGLVAWETSRYWGNRAGRSVMAEDWVAQRDPEYEKAEEEWAKGNHLEAIGLMREYLKKNPDEQHVALRIAEIYEKDMNNPVAAVLEIEEVLTRKLGREKWGWTAIRLSNLYSGRLNQPEKALALLNRIVNQYGETAAAKKARQRLGIPEPEPEESSDRDTEEAEAESTTPAASAAPAEAPPPAEPVSNLPKGFRPKK